MTTHIPEKHVIDKNRTLFLEVKGLKELINKIRARNINEYGYVADHSIEQAIFDYENKHNTKF